MEKFFINPTKFYGYNEYGYNELRIEWIDESQRGNNYIYINNFKTFLMIL